MEDKSDAEIQRKIAADAAAKPGFLGLSPNLWRLAAVLAIA